MEGVMIALVCVGYLAFEKVKDRLAGRPKNNQ